MIEEKNESTPRVIAEFVGEGRQRQFTTGGICEVFIGEQREGGGEIKKVCIEKGNLHVELHAYLRPIGGKMTIDRKYPPLDLKGTDAWRDGEDVVIREQGMKIVLRTSLQDKEERHETEKREDAAA